MELRWQKKGYSWFSGKQHTRLFVFRQTRASEAPIAVIGNKKLPLAPVTDKYGGYTALRQYCYAHLLRAVIVEMEFPG